MDDPKFDHLKEGLHVLIEAKGPEKVAEAKLAAGVAEVKKMIIPGVSEICKIGTTRDQFCMDTVLLHLTVLLVWSLLVKIASLC